MGNPSVNISVIIPMFNAEKTILEAINSVINELKHYTYTWEIIIIDDGSTDSSYKIVSKYVEQSGLSNLFIFTQVNSGASAARNLGIKNAVGSFIAFNDSDDRWVSGRLRYQMKLFLDDPDLMLVAGKYSTHNISSIRKINGLTEIRIIDQVLKNYFSPPAAMIRKKILAKSGLFNEQLKYAEEGWFFNNIVAFGKSKVYPDVVAEPVILKAAFGESGLSGNLFSMERGELTNIKNAYNKKYISFPQYARAVIFSLIKFIRRLYISKFNRK